MMKELRAWNKRMQEEGKAHMLIQPKDVLRRVKSRILFEQMLGRATRLCPQDP